MKFNPTTTYNSIVVAIDNLVDTNENKYPILNKAIACNSALDKAYAIFHESVDSKGYDDKNFATLPQGTFDIVAGERNITVDKDDEDAEILKIYRVIAKNESGNWYELTQKDIRDKDSRDIAYGDTTGQVSAYDWVGSSLVFDVVPEANISGGIKVFYMRNSEYFIDTDTDKEPGLPALFHDYLVYYASWQYAMKKGLQRKADLLREVEQMEVAIAQFASSQSVEKNKRVIPFVVNAE